MTSQRKIYKCNLFSYKISPAIERAITQILQELPLQYRLRQAAWGSLLETKRRDSEMYISGRLPPSHSLSDHQAMVVERSSFQSNEPYFAVLERRSNMTNVDHCLQIFFDTVSMAEAEALWRQEAEDRLHDVVLSDANVPPRGNARHASRYMQVSIYEGPGLDRYIPMRRRRVGDNLLRYGNFPTAAERRCMRVGNSTLRNEHELFRHIFSREYTD